MNRISCLNINNNRCKTRPTFLNAISCSKTQKLTVKSLNLSWTVNSRPKLKTSDIFHIPQPKGDKNSYSKKFTCRKTLKTGKN